MPPAQQPPEQLSGPQPEHCWPTHICRAPHIAQALPFLPHSFWPVPVLHRPFTSQQPVGQLVASQPQTPLEQCCPAGHAPVLRPQTQAPVAVQRSARIGSHVAQTCAGAPHAPTDCIGGWRQLMPLQQPVEQESAVHLHVPA